ncbi:MAG: DNA-binding domain-containing protein [Pseudomonas sp.]|uniref:DNA-binding domain-containing protein n=1 Tax=Pseudomonas sp. TaxID=306 RepID=UPI0030F24222
MRLRDWQLSVEAYLLAGQAQPAPALLGSVQGSATLSAETGLAIYHNAYRARLLETLRGDFPAVLAWLGDEAFAQLAAAYLQACPSEHFSLRWLGARFPAFIEASEHPAALAELAHLEWAFTLAFDAPAGDPLTLEQMASLPAAEWPNLRITWLPSVQRLPQTYNSLALWRATKQEAPLPASEGLPAPLLCLVWRQGLQGQFRTLAADEAQALLGMTEGGWSFAELCLSLERVHEQPAAQAAGWLKQWLSEGLLQRADLYG